MYALRAGPWKRLNAHILPDVPHCCIYVSHPVLPGLHRRYLIRTLMIACLQPPSYRFPDRCIKESASFSGVSSNSLTRVVLYGDLEGEHQTTVCHMNLWHSHRRLPWRVLPASHAAFWFIPNGRHFFPYVFLPWMGWQWLLCPPGLSAPAFFPFLPAYVHRAG